MSPSLARQALSVVTNRWLLNLCNFVTFIVIARVLTSQDFGIYGVFTSAVFLVETAGTLGLRQSTAQEVGQRRLTDGEALGASLILWPFSGLTCGLLVLWSMGGSIDVPWSVEWLGPSLVATFAVVLGSLCQGVFLGRGEIRNFNFVEILPRLSLLVPVVLLAIIGHSGVVLQAWLFAASFALTALLALRLAMPHQSSLQPNPGAVWILIKRGWPYALTQFLVMLNTRVSVFILSGHIDPTAAGEYFAALRINDLLLQSAASIGLVLFSHSTRAKDPLVALKQAAQVTRWLTWATVILSAVGLVLAPLVIHILLGPHYAASVPALQLLLLALPFATLSKVVSPTLSGLGRPLLSAVVVAPALVVNAALSYALVGPLGVTGAGIAMGVSQIVVAVSYVLTIKRVFGTPMRDFVVPRRAEFIDVKQRIVKKIAKPRSSKP